LSHYKFFVAALGVLLILSITSSNAFAAHSNSIAHVKIWTDKTSYMPGEKVEVSVAVQPTEIDEVAVIYVFNPQELYTGDVRMPGVDGMATFSFTLPEEVLTGTWRVSAEYSDGSDEATFSVSDEGGQPTPDPKPSSAWIKLSAAESYSIGEAALVKAEVGPLSQEPLIIRIFGPDANTYFFEKFLLRDEGLVEFIFDISEEYVVGDWTIIASYIEASDKATFSVLESLPESTSAPTIKVETQVRSQLTLDNRIYKAGDTVLLRGVVSPSSILSVVMRDDEGHIQIEKEITGGDDGSISFSFQLAVDAKPGTWSLEVVNGDAPVKLEFDVVLNNPPEANDQNVSTNTDTPVVITLAGSDLDGDSIAFSIVNNPAKGSLSGEAPNITYEPDSNFSGTDTFAFRVNDGSLDSDIATISITINEVRSLEIEPFTVSSTFDGNSYAISGISESVQVIAFTINPNQSVEIELDGEGEMELTLPKILVDGIYTVMSEGQNIPFEETSITPTTTTIRFSITGPTDSVEIIGTTVVPEFSTIMAFVLAMSFLAVLGLGVSRGNRLSCFSRE